MSIDSDIADRYSADQVNQYADEYDFSESEVETVTSAEDDLLENIRHQVANVFGDFTGETDTTHDYILHYISEVYNGDVYLIENFESFCSQNEKEGIYDLLTNTLLDIFSKIIGVNVDTHREICSFEDIYDIYCIFVLSFRNTVEFCTVNRYIKNGISLKDIKPNAVTEFCLSDEFSPNDSLISNAAEYSQDLALLNIKEKIADNIISIDPVIFGKFIYEFITTNDVKISEKILNG